MAPFYYAPEDGALYTLVAPDGSRCVFNDQTDPDFCGINASATGLDSPDVMVATDTLVGADGGYNGNFYYGNRPITLNGMVYGFPDIPTRNLMLAKIMGASNAMQSDGALYLQPSPQAWGYENFIKNPSFEYGITGWLLSGPSGATMVQSNSWASSGTYSLALNGTTSSSFTSLSGNSSGTGLNGLPVQAGATYTFGATFNITAIPSGATPRVFLNVYDKNGATISGLPPSAQNGTVGTTGVQTIVKSNYTLPANAAFVEFRAQIICAGGGPYGVTTFNLDSCFFSRNSSVFTDGDQAGNWWSGTPGNSVSGNFVPMYTTFRRQQPTRFNGQWQKNYQLLLTSQYAPLFSANQVVIAGGTSVNCENFGNYPAAPVVRVFGAGSSATINVTNTTTGQYVQINGPASLGAGHWLDIDMLNHTAVDDTGTSWNQYINFGLSSWPTLGPRSVSNWIVDAGGASLQVTYRHCWV
jgi:hypothetical protein